VERVQIRMDAANAASARVPAKLGYRLLGDVQREVEAPGHTAVGLGGRGIDGRGLVATDDDA
jgi:RimJ/RimL family protein N-acetyltransferase